MTVTAPETGRDRLVIAHEAGYRRLSLVSVIAGVFVAYGAFAVFVAIAAGLLDALNITTLDVYDWNTVGTAGAAVLAGSLLLAYLFGGYAAGRMARRAGVVQGLGVLVLGVAVAVAIGFAFNAWTDSSVVADRLRSVGIPTSRHEWSSVGTIAGVASLAAIFLGSLLGGVLGDRWHSKLTARAADPGYGPEAEFRRQAAERDVDLREDTRPVVTGKADTEVINPTRPADAENLPDEARTGSRF